MIVDDDLEATGASSQGPTAAKVRDT